MTNTEPTKLIYGYTEAVHALAETYIRRDILKCDSLLIGKLIEQSWTADRGSLAENFDVTDIENYYGDSTEAIEDFLTDHLDYDSWVSLPFDEKEFLAGGLGFDPQPQEIYEWWAVTEWLADKLIEFGQPVLKNDYGQWWGRTCTGQAIILDGTLQKIAESHI